MELCAGGTIGGEVEPCVTTQHETLQYKIIVLGQIIQMGLVFGGSPCP